MRCIFYPIAPSPPNASTKLPPTPPITTSPTSTETCGPVLHPPIIRLDLILLPPPTPKKNVPSRQASPSQLKPVQSRHLDNLSSSPHILSFFRPAIVRLFDSVGASLRFSSS